MHDVLLQHSTNSYGAVIGVQMKRCCRRPNMGERKDGGLRWHLLQGVEGLLTACIPHEGHVLLLQVMTWSSYFCKFVNVVTIV